MKIFNQRLLQFGFLSNLLLASQNALALQDEVVAVVNDHAITKTELQEQKHRLVAGISPEQRGQLTDQQVLEQYVNQLVQVQLAEKMGLHIDAKEVSRAIEHLALRNHESVDAYLKSLALSREDFRQQIQQELMVRELQKQELAGTIQVSDREINDYWNSMRHNHPDMPAEPDDEAKAQLRELVFARKFEQKVGLWLAEQRDHSYIDMRSLADL